MTRLLDLPHTRRNQLQTVRICDHRIGADVVTKRYKLKKNPSFQTKEGSTERRFCAYNDHAERKV
ncbi:protein of unknown function [Thauera humireducens]|nr:protein of unknown function [Thauera humireducens]